MSYIPEELIVHILSQIPVEPLLRFRCVSKQWRALIDSPCFINSHLNQSLKANTNLSVILRYNNLYSVELDSLDGVLKLNNDTASSFKLPKKTVKLDLPSRPKRSSIIVGSCNGLICLLNFSSVEDKDIVLLNPCTRKHKILPRVPPYSGYRAINEIAYDPVNDDYKIVRVIHGVDKNQSLQSKVMVYGLRSNSWRRVHDSFPYQLRYHNYEYSGVVVNGALHWVASRHPELPLVDEFIVAFDPVVGNYWEMQPPSVSDYSYVNLGVLGGSLCLFYGYDYGFMPKFVELWVMKDYMVLESWTKVFVAVWPQRHPNFRNSHVRILDLSKSTSEVLLIQKNNKLFWFDLKEQTVVDSEIHSFQAEICVESLVKLTSD